MNEDRNKEQEKLRKYHSTKNKVEYFILNGMIGIACVVLGAMTVMDLLKPERTPQDNEQMIMCAALFLMLVIISWLGNKGGDILFEKFLLWIAKVKEQRNIKIQNEVKDLDTALHCMSKKNGVVVGDVLWCGPAFLFSCCLFIQGGNKILIFECLLFSVVMLLVGHFIGTKLWKAHHYEKRLIKYTRRYLDIADEKAYIVSADQSIQRGILGYAGLWLLTDEFVFGRLSDIWFEVVAIPRDEVEQFTFFYRKRISERTIPTGILRCHLQNGKYIDFVAERGRACEQVLKILSMEKIYFEVKETEYGI